jgi:hypothetical protein
MFRKKLAMYLVGAAMLILPLLATAQPASATTAIGVSASTGSADPTDVVIMSWFKHSEWPEKWACNEWGEFLTENYPIYCGWSCVYRGGIFELWMLPCGGHSLQDLPAQTAVKL